MVKSYRVGGGLQDYTVSFLGQVIVIVISRPRSLTIFPFELLVLLKLCYALKCLLMHSQISALLNHLGSLSLSPKAIQKCCQLSSKQKSVALLYNLVIVYPYAQISSLPSHIIPIPLFF